MSPLEKAHVELGEALGAIDEVCIMASLYPGDTERIGKYLHDFLKRRRTTSAPPGDK